MRRGCYYGVNRRNAGGGSGQDRRRAESRAGGEPTMCPFGRTPLIPLQLEINESLILHPLLLPLSSSHLPPPSSSSCSHEFHCRRPCRVPLWQSYRSGGHRSRRSPGTLYLPVPRHRSTGELILNLPSVSACSVPLLSPAGHDLDP